MDRMLEKVESYASSKFATDFEAQQEFIQSMTKSARSHKAVEANSDQPIYACNNRQTDTSDDKEVFDFFPVYSGELSAAHPNVTYSGKCFENITMTYEQTSISSFDVVVDLQDPVSKTC